MGWAALPTAAQVQEATVSTLSTDELAGYEDYPEEVKRLVETALALTEMNLTYMYGSADPAQGGMDCSGTIYYVLRSLGVVGVPRTASAQYLWTRKAGTFEAVISRKMDSYELQALRPGDLLFWTGTYATPVDPPVTHSMIYLGKLKDDGRPVMFGASNGRPYANKRMWGVSVFDFRIPQLPVPASEGQAVRSSSVFIGYARIPGMQTD